MEDIEMMEFITDSEDKVGAMLKILSMSNEEFIEYARERRRKCVHPAEFVKMHELNRTLFVCSFCKKRVIIPVEWQERLKKEHGISVTTVNFMFRMKEDFETYDAFAQHILSKIQSPKKYDIEKTLRHPHCVGMFWRADTAKFVVVHCTASMVDPQDMTLEEFWSRHSDE